MLESLHFQGKKVPIFHQKDITDVPWADMGVDAVIDASGVNSKLRDHYGQVKLNKVYPYSAVWGVCQDKAQVFTPDMLQQRYDQAKVMIGLLPVGTGGSYPASVHATNFHQIFYKISFSTDQR